MQQMIFGTKRAIDTIAVIYFLPVESGMYKVSAKGLGSGSLGYASFGFMTGVLQSGHFFALLSSSTPQLTQYDNAFTSFLFIVTFNFYMNAELNKSSEKFSFNVGIFKDIGK